MENSGIPAVETQLAPARRRRLTGQKEHAPWVRAETLASHFLFWLPVSGFPLVHDERAWLLEFLNRFSAFLGKAHGLRCEAFLEYAALSPQQKIHLQSYAVGRRALLGVGRSSDEDLTPLLTPEEAQERLRTMEPGKTVAAGRQLLWFLNKGAEQQRELFFGEGCVTMMFLPPDPATTPPKLPLTPALRAAHPAFQQYDVDASIEAAYAETDAFLGKSKKLFKKGLDTRAEWAKARFVLPLFASADFLKAPEDLRNRWFDLADVYLFESRADGGVLLAFQKEAFQEALTAVLESMQTDALIYTRKGYLG